VSRDKGTSSRNYQHEVFTMTKLVQKTTASVLLALACVAGGAAVSHAQDNVGAAVFDDKGRLQLPVDYRHWVFIGAPLTPHGLNGGKAAFPEFHHVYVNPDAYAVYERTGEFPQGTVIAKELVLLRAPDHADGSSNEASGRGYFGGAFNGMDVMVKDSTRFANTRGWGFFNFGHHQPPYAEAALAADKASCAGCHEANAHRDMVFTELYPVLQR
jgi:hypothetical protein